MAGKTLRVELVAANKAVWAGEAKLVVGKTVEGESGLMPGHEPMLAILANGEVRVTKPEGEVLVVTADDGFLSVEHDVVTVVARNASGMGVMISHKSSPGPIELAKCAVWGIALSSKYQNRAKPIMVVR